MATAPRVQTLAEAMRDLDPAYAASRDIVTKRQQALPGKYDAQRAGIYAARGEGFNTINNQATGRGASFSGIPQDEQARYLSTKFLPGLQQADFQQNEEDLNLQGQLAGIDKEQRLGAQGRVDKQQSDLNAWNQMIAQQEFQAREAEKQRQFQAAQAAEQRKFTAAQSAIARAHAASLRAPRKLSPFQSAMNVIAAGVGGRDQGVSVNTFQMAREAYRQAGGDTRQFASEFWKFVPKSRQRDDGANGWRAYYYG